MNTLLTRMSTVIYFTHVFDTAQTFLHKHITVKCDVAISGPQQCGELLHCKLLSQQGYVLC